jgi:8-oxo-dGTP pyrophosphatase MutT (NUDIX family)
MSALPRDAASVILVRHGAAGEQALLIRRDASLAFAGDTWVFPGGKLEPSDGAPETLAKIGLADDARSATGAPSSIAPDLGLLVAACRETFEETGIVLATRTNGAPCDSKLADALQPHRAELLRNPALFASMLADNELIVEPARFIRWSHWITPSLSPKRFDTRFFVAMMPADQKARCDSAEASELLWLDLRTADALPDASLIPAPPTRYSLGDLAVGLRTHGCIERLMESESARHVATIVPKMLRLNDQLTVLMPWDSAYASASGEGIHPGTRIPPHYLSFPSRVIPPAQMIRMIDAPRR